MHVAHINFFPAPKGVAAADVFAQWPSLADIPEATASSGIRVSFVQAATHEERLTRAGIAYQFVDVSDKKTVRARSHYLASQLNTLKADVLHVHGLGFAEDAFAVAHFLPRLPMLLQDHADRPPRWWRRLQWRRWYGSVAGVAFTSAELARPFTDAGLFAPPTQLFAIPESSSRFTPGSRAHARAKTGLHGDPCALWVGHLNAGKDPLTVLEGIAQASAHLPGLQLWCAFGNAPLHAEVQRRVDEDARLRGRVHLVGKVPHSRIELFMQAADIFVSGSRAESCGYALLEAMACGTAPVVTDIPSFRALTGNGRVGRLWPCGDSARLAQALIEIAQEPPSRPKVRQHFDHALSFAAVGRQWAAAYAQLLQGRSSA